MDDKQAADLLAEVQALRDRLDRVQRDADSRIGQLEAELTARAAADPRDSGSGPGGARPGAPASEADPGEAATESSHLSRRKMILGGLGAVAGAAALEVAAAGPAAATTGNMQFGLDNQAGTAATGLYSTNTDWTLVVRNTSDSGVGTQLGIVGSSSVGTGVRGDTAGAPGEAGVAGYATYTATGVRGQSSAGPGVAGVSAQGSGVEATSSTGAGLLAISTGGAGVSSSSTNSTAVVANSTNSAALQLIASRSTINPAAAFQTGMFFVTLTGEVWFCVQSGTPGKWRLLASPASAGGYVAITPIRVFDSRWGAVPGVTTGRLQINDNRTISVADARNNNGGIVTANAIPSGATAVTVNMTIADTQGGGYLTLVPGGVTDSFTSTINWSATGQILSNGGVAALNVADRTVNALCRAGSTQLVLDVTGYYLGK